MRTQLRVTFDSISSLYCLVAKGGAKPDWLQFVLGGVDAPSAEPRGVHGHTVGRSQ
jgi:hypothetical protein